MIKGALKIFCKSSFYDIKFLKWILKKNHNLGKRFKDLNLGCQASPLFLGLHCNVKSKPMVIKELPKINQRKLLDNM